MKNAVVIDDEVRSRGLLVDLINKFCPHLDVVGEASNVAKGLDLLAHTKVDVVFLDVEMPDGTGFDLLQNYGMVDFRVIFVSAYDHYAVQAFQYSAVDYLLKPVESGRLLNAVKKVMDEDRFDALNQKIELLLHNRRSFDKVALPSTEGIQFVKVDDIIRCESSNNYTFIYLNNSKRILVTKTLKEYDEMLTPANFIRVHKSHLVNTAYIKEYKKGEGGSLILEDGMEVLVSRRRKEQLLDFLMSQ